MAQPDDGAGSEIRCASFLVGLGPFASPQETAHLSRKLRELTIEYTNLVEQTRMLCDASRVDHQLETAGTALDFLPRDFSRIPSELDEFIEAMQTRSWQLQTARWRLQAALYKLTGVNLTAIEERDREEVARIALEARGGEDTTARIGTPQNANENTFRAILMGLPPLEQELLRRARVLSSDLVGLGHEAKWARDKLIASLESLPELPERLSMGFDPGYGMPWLRVQFTDSTGTEHITAVPHPLGLLNDRDPETPTMGRSVPPRPRGASTKRTIARLKGTERRHTTSARRDVRRDVRRMLAELAELRRPGWGDIDIAFTRSSLRLTAANQVGNRIILASLTGIPAARDRGYVTGALLLVRPLTPGNIQAYLFADGDSGFGEYLEHPSARAGLRRARRGLTARPHSAGYETLYATADQHRIRRYRGGGHRGGAERRLRIGRHRGLSDDHGPELRRTRTELASAVAPDRRWGIDPGLRRDGARVRASSRWRVSQCRSSRWHQTRLASIVGRRCNSPDPERSGSGDAEPVWEHTDLYRNSAAHHP